jgi:hypothetical protein
MRRVVTAWFRVAALTVAAVVVGSVRVPSVQAAVPVEPSSSVPTAVPLPTVQTDGIVWAVQIVGNTVYAGGRFTKARPAGTASGDPAEVPRGNILAFDLATGALLPFAPNIDAETYTSTTPPDKFCKTVGTNMYKCDAVFRIKASPDGSRIYVAGDFSLVNGRSRQRIAAFDTATGALSETFRPTLDGRVRGLAVTSSAVYVGGSFTTVNGTVSRDRLAAFDSNGAVLGWAPRADESVWSLSAAPGLSRVLIGGAFDTVNGLAVHGLMAVDAVSGANAPWATRAVTLSSIVTDIVNDGTTAYLTGYNYNGGAGSARFEGRMAVDIATGVVRWIDSCYGDTQAVTIMNNVLYSASHAHDCSMMNEFPQPSPTNYQRIIAETTGAAGFYQGSGTSLVPNGSPIPAWVHFLPDLDGGPSTSPWKNGPWALDNNGTYLVVGGEFLTVNGTAQQSLTRFAVPPVGPKTSAGRGFNTPTATVRPDGTVRVSFTSTYDRDSSTLRYELLRSDDTSRVRATRTLPAQWWQRSAQVLVDRTLAAGQAVTYKVRSVDPDGNVASTLWSASVTGTGTPPALRRYPTAVTATAPAAYWRLGESSGTSLADTVGGDDLTTGTGVALGAAGILSDEANTATTFNGTSSGIASTRTSRYAPESFSVETWFKTTTSAGGQLIGWGTSQTGNSGSSDRKLYLDNSGHLLFGVNPGGRRTVGSQGTYRDGQWHHAVGTLGTDGMTLYVDGSQVAADPTVTSAQYLTTGYWRLGGDSLSGWPSAPSSGYLSGTMDEAATYRGVLSAAQVSAHYAARMPATPAASFTASCTGRACTFDGTASQSANGPITGYGWDFGDGMTGTGGTTSHTYATEGTFTVRMTVTDSSDRTASTTRSVTVQAPPTPGTIASDDFLRSVDGGWGSADVGGPWTVSSTVADYSVSGGAGIMTVPASGATRSATLDSLAAGDVDQSVQVTLSALPAAGSTYAYLVTRRSAANVDYRARVRVGADGSVRVAIVSRSGSSTDVILGTETVVSGLTLAPGGAVRVRLQASGSSPTILQAKVWDAGGAEPADWQKTAADSTSAQQAPGACGVAVTVSSSNTAVPLTASFRSYRAVVPQ